MLAEERTAAAEKGLERIGAMSAEERTGYQGYRYVAKHELPKQSVCICIIFLETFVKLRTDKTIQQQKLTCRVCKMSLSNDFAWRHNLTAH
jgi:hypothetical protein